MDLYPWGHKELDTTEGLKHMLNQAIYVCINISAVPWPDSTEECQTEG